MLPFLTVAADVFGIIGGGLVASGIFNLDYNAYLASVRTGISVQDVVGGVLKPLVFGFVIGGICCYKGLSTKDGTVGVGRSTTDSVVLSSIWVIILDFFLSRAINSILGIKYI